MGYPNMPSNRMSVKVNGTFVDLSTKFKMVMGDGYTMNPPEPKTYYVDIPGSDGRIDLTETLLGRAAYGTRTQEFTFYIFDVDNVSTLKAEILQYLHGKAFDYKLTFDPDFVYHGRFTVTSIADALYNNVGRMVVVRISIEADPYKTKNGVKYL